MFKVIDKKTGGFVKRNLTRIEADILCDTLNVDGMGRYKVFAHEI